MAVVTYLLTMRPTRAEDFGTVGREAKQRLNSDNDIKIIIQGKNSQTGIGKTTLATEMARAIDQNGWSAEEKAYIDVGNYLSDFLDMEPQSVMLLDEIGAGADSRRSMSTDNVELSQGWQMLRARNIATIATLPSTNMLDKRMLELADYWILVKERGKAKPYKIKVNDFNGTVARDQIGPNQGEHIIFPDLPNGDADKKYLDSIKDNKIENGSLEKISLAEHNAEVEKAQEKARKAKRNEMIQDIYTYSDLSYAAIGNMPTVDLTKQTVGEICRGDY